MTATQPTNSAKAVNWLGDDIYPNGYPSEASYPKAAHYIPCSKNRAFFHGIDRICKEIWAIACKMGKDETIPPLAADFMSMLIAMTPTVFRKYSIVNPKRFNEAEKKLTEYMRTVETGMKCTDDIAPKVGDMLEFFPEKLQYISKRIHRISGFELTKEEFAIVGKPYGTYPSNDVFFDCYRFVFFHLHEEKAFECVFDTQSNKGPQLDKVVSWGYKELKKEEAPRAGDLAACMRHAGGIGFFPQHFGIFIGKDRMVSKWGSSDVHNHKIKHSPLQHGDGCVFYRKVTRFAVLETMANSLVEMKKALLDAHVEKKSLSEAPVIVKHPVAHCVRSTKFVLIYCKRVFNQLLLEAAPKMLPRSLFGRSRLIFLKQGMQKAVAQLLEPLRKDPLSTSRLEAIAAFNAAMNNVSDEVPLDLTLLTLDSH